MPIRLLNDCKSGMEFGGVPGTIVICEPASLKSYYLYFFELFTVSHYAVVFCCSASKNAYLFDSFIIYYYLH